MVAAMGERALFIPDGDGYVGTILIQGGWDPGAANGGMALALLGHCLEDVPTLAPMSVSRITADLVRPVPIGPRLHVRHRVVREGKKIQVVELLLLAGDVEHVRASVLRLRHEDLGARTDLPPSTTTARPADALVPPQEGEDFRGRGTVGFLDAVDFRATPTRDGSGIGSWLRLEAEVVAGQPIRPTSRLAAAIDFANLIGVAPGQTGVTMINADVSAQVLRDPVGEWIAVTGDTRFHAATGRGVSSAELSDADGVFAVASTSQLLQPRRR
jgi:acyl-coenzyme A thioesterase PaaI-like protein